MKYIYAAYGSNMNHKQMAKRCPKAKFIGTGRIDDHALVFRRVADIEEREGKSVTVALWELTNACVDALDAYEGFPNLYTIKNVVVATKKGSVKAFVYVMNDQTHYAAPSEPYLASIANGYEHCGLTVTKLVNQFI